MAPIQEVSHLLFSEVTSGEQVQDEAGAKSGKEVAGITTGESGLPQETYGEGEGKPKATRRNYTLIIVILTRNDHLTVRKTFVLVL